MIIINKIEAKDQNPLAWKNADILHRRQANLKALIRIFGLEIVKKIGETAVSLLCQVNPLNFANEIESREYYTSQQSPSNYTSQQSPSNFFVPP